MRIVLLGGAGYIGTTVCAELAESGHDVLVVDDLIYTLDGRPPSTLRGTFLRGDFRDEELLQRVLPGADAVVHLGGLVGEPACAIDEALSVELNFASPVLAGEVAAMTGVGRFVFLSTCSVYGRQEGLVSEETVPNPLSCYALTKQVAETRLAEILTGRAELVVLRLATVFGLSSRMRLDSVVNSMASRAAVTGTIPLRGGSAWRPLVHVRDVARCVRRIVEGETASHAVKPLVLNVGHEENNHTIAEIAETVVSRVSGAAILKEDAVTDQRDYRVSFERIARLLPGACRTPITEGIDEIAAAARAGQFPDPAAVRFDNLRGLRAALDEGRVAARGDGAMLRLRAEYDGHGAVVRARLPEARDTYDELAAARYWGGERLAGVPGGDADAEDAIVLCEGKPLWVGSAYARWELSCLEDMLPNLAGAHVLDLGCGVGRIIRELAERCGSVTGVDLAPGMLDRAKRRTADLPNVRIELGSVAEVPLPDASADVLVCLGVFEHVPAEHRSRALAEMARVLKPGGQAVLELNNASSALLAEATGDNPYRIGRQLNNGYYCELVHPDAVVAEAAQLGLAEVERTANPFYSVLRHGQDGMGTNAGEDGGPSSEKQAELYRQALSMDRVLGGSPALRAVADQHMVRLVKR